MPFSIASCSEVRAPGPGGDRHVHGRADRRHAHLLRTVERDRPDVAGLVLVGAHHFLLRFDERFPAVGDLHHVDVRRVEQALGVVLQPEDRGAFDGLVGAHALEYGEAVVQRVGEDVGGRGTPGHELAVVPDESVAIGHRHEKSPEGLLNGYSIGNQPVIAPQGKTACHSASVAAICSFTSSCGTRAYLAPFSRRPCCSRLNSR